jgi:hypothetical protein
MRWLRLVLAAALLWVGAPAVQAAPDCACCPCEPRPACCLDLGRAMRPAEPQVQAARRRCEPAAFTPRGIWQDEAQPGLPTQALVWGPEAPRRLAWLRVWRK